MGLTSLFLEMENKNVLIVGAGSVGVRRAHRFLDAGANVAIITRSIDKEIKNELLKKGAIFYDNSKLDEQIDKCHLIVVSTNNQELNRKISNKAKNKLINCASDISLSNVIVPSTFKIGSVTVSLYTDSKSPLMAKELRKKIQKTISEQDILNIELQEYLRKLLKENVNEQIDRKNYMIKIKEDTYIQGLLEKGEINKAKIYVKKLINELD